MEDEPNLRMLVMKKAAGKFVHCVGSIRIATEKQIQCLNFRTIYGEPSRNRVVVTARQSPNLWSFKELTNRF